ncbi:site-specific DNA-methyltransferase [Puniceicoccaceae bacterium]|jgi:DNA modification methylase|nr:site-specific DNA-methyltransferase [Puniceicoccaceae bacterium]
MEEEKQYHLIYGDGSSMEIIRNGEVDLVMTSPPYFDLETEGYLKLPRREQTEISMVRERITSFALSIRPVYEEIRRILRPGGILAIQVKDVNYGGFLFPVSSIHREMAESTGLLMLTRTFWHKYGRRSDATKFLRNPKVGAFRADQVEEIMIFSDGEVTAGLSPPVDLPFDEIQEATNPTWNFSPVSGSSRVHRHQSPDAMIKRLVLLFSKPGDLVVDPFAGAGTTLSTAVKLGRRAIGYEIDERTVGNARPAIKRSIAKTLIKH